MSAAAQARQIQKVYSEWCVKAAEIILASRIDDPGSAESPPQTSASFNLRVPELFGVRAEAIARAEFFQLKTQRSFQVEIYVGGLADSCAGDDEPGELLERWTFTFFPAHPEPAVPDRFNQTLVRKLSVTLRSLMCFARLLPAYSFCRGLQGSSPRHWRFRVEAWPPTSRVTAAQELVTQDFISLQSSVGTLRLSVSQRKDLKSAPANGVFRSTTAIGSQLDPMEVEEGYFAGSVDAPPSADPAASLGRLHKIAEEPEARVPGPHTQAELRLNDGAEQPSLSTTPSSAVHEPASARGDRTARPRLSSEDSNASTVSASSKAYSAPDHVVVLGATPPLAAAFGTSPPPGLITLGPHHRSDSASSSRSLTPQTTPKLGPLPEPSLGSSNAEQRCRVPVSGAAAATAGAAAATGSTTSLVAAASSVLSTAMAPAGIVAPGVAEHTPSPGLGTSMPPVCRPGELDDLSGIWMSCPPEWGGRRRSLSLGTCSRGSGAYSRSLSPEDTTQRTALAAAAAEAPGASSATTAGGGSSSSGHCGGRRAARDGPSRPAEAESEICMFGMSDDEEDELASEEDDDMEHNVVANTMKEGGGAAFANTCIDPGRLGLASLDLPDQAAAQRPAAGNEAAGTPRMLSPLIAQLNPFTPPPRLDLPPAALGPPGIGETAVVARGPAEMATTGAAAPVESPGVPQDVQHLLAEMGDLVCKLQQKQELHVTSQEVPSDELLERLAHFRELARSPELRCRS